MMLLRIWLESTAGIGTTEAGVGACSEPGLEEAGGRSTLAGGVAGAGGGRPGTVAGDQTRAGAVV